MKTLTNNQIEKQKLDKILTECAGSPTELKRVLKGQGRTYVKVRSGFITKYVIKGKGIQDKITIIL